MFRVAEFGDPGDDHTLLITEVSGYDLSGFGLEELHVFDVR